MTHTQPARYASLLASAAVIITLNLAGATSAFAHSNA